MLSDEVIWGNNTWYTTLCRTIYSKAFIEANLWSIGDIFFKMEHLMMLHIYRLSHGWFEIWFLSTSD